MDFVDIVAPPKNTLNNFTSAVVGGCTYAGVAMATTSLPPLAVALGVFASIATARELEGRVRQIRSEKLLPTYQATPIIGTWSAFWTWSLFSATTATLASKVVASFVYSAFFLGYNFLGDFPEINSFHRPALYTGVFAAALLVASATGAFTLPNAMVISALPLAAATVASVVTSLAIAQLQGKQPFAAR